MRQPSGSALQGHIELTYLLLRVGVGVLAVLLPIILAIGGFAFYRLDLQDSISAYYHAFVATTRFPDVFAIDGHGLMRNWFVGILWAIGFFLILYKGFGRRESRALNVAGVLLIMVSMFPMGWTCRDTCSRISTHGVSAVLFFFAIGYVCIFRSGDTLALLPVRQQAAYQKIYRAIGSVMWVFPLAVALLEAARIRVFGTHTVFFVEVAGIWTFAAFWLLKSFEIARTGADHAVISGRLVRPAQKKGIIGYWLDTSPLVDQSTNSTGG